MQKETETPAPDQKKPQAVTDKPKETKAAKKSIDLKHYFQTVTAFVIRFQIPMALIFIGIILALTALRTISYINPPPNQSRVEQNLNQAKTVVIDQKAINKIKSLSDSQVTTGTNIENGRTNPFSE